MLKGKSSKKSGEDASREELRARWYAPPLTPGDGRPLRLVQAIERVVPWADLRHEMREGYFSPKLLADRDSVLNGAGAAGKIPLICNKDAKRAITILHIPEHGPESAVKLDVTVYFPPEPDIVQRAADLAAAMGTALNAFWGDITPLSTGSTIASQAVPEGSRSTPGYPPPGLPELALREHIDSPYVPYGLGWVCYWSKETAERIDFPDPARHAELLERSRKLENGAWVVQLTDEPLYVYVRFPVYLPDGSYEIPEPWDLSNPEHKRILARAYELLPAIGGRDTLAQP